MLVSCVKSDIELDAASEIKINSVVIKTSDNPELAYNFYIKAILIMIKSKK